jgi:hypothetical protein
MFVIVGFAFDHFDYVAEIKEEAFICERGCVWCLGAYFSAFVFRCDVVGILLEWQ